MEGLGAKLYDDAHRQAFKAYNGCHADYRSRAARQGVVSFDDLVFLYFFDQARVKAREFGLTPLEFVQVTTGAAPDDTAGRVHHLYLEIAEFYGPTFAVKNIHDFSYIGYLERLLS